MTVQKVLFYNLNQKVNPQNSDFMALEGCGFERWKKATNQPNATKEDYFEAVRLHKEQLKTKGRSFLPPKVANIPGGVIVSLVGITSQDYGSMAREYVQSSRTNH